MTHSFANTVRLGTPGWIYNRCLCVHYMCMCVCIPIYIYIYVCVCAFIYIYIYAKHILIYLCVRVPICSTLLCHEAKCFHQAVAHPWRKTRKNDGCHRSRGPEVKAARSTDLAIECATVNCTRATTDKDTIYIYIICVCVCDYVILYAYIHMMYGILPNECFQAKTETYYDILRPWNHGCSREYISIWHTLW